jgi:hypothetical protein
VDQSAAIYIDQQPGTGHNEVWRSSQDPRRPCMHAVPTASFANEGGRCDDGLDTTGCSIFGVTDMGGWPRTRKNTCSCMLLTRLCYHKKLEPRAGYHISFSFA